MCIQQKKKQTLYVNISVSFLASLTICMIMKSFYPSHPSSPLDELCSRQPHARTHARTYTRHTRTHKCRHHTDFESTVNHITQAHIKPIPIVILIVVIVIVIPRETSEIRWFQYVIDQLWISYRLVQSLVCLCKSTTTRPVITSSDIFPPSVTRTPFFFFLHASLSFFFFSFAIGSLFRGREGASGKREGL